MKLLVVLSVILAVAAGEVLAGQVTILEGDTLDLDGRRVRLAGIDAPELRQTCEARDGSTWA